MDTNIGNAFVYGDLRAVDAVTFDEIGGKYLYVEKIKEKYTMHTRVVTYTTGSGKTMQTHTRTETYWTWDVIGSEEKESKEVKFCNVVFPAIKVQRPDPEFIRMINESNHIRYKYYGTPIKSITEQFTLYYHMGLFLIDPNFLRIIRSIRLWKVVPQKCGMLFSGVLWVIVICGCDYNGFCYLDNWMVGRLRRRR